MTPAQKKNAYGFSLVELLVVATVIIVLTTIGLVSFQNASRNARDAKRKADLETVRQALVLRRADQGNYQTLAGQTAGNYTTVTTALISANYLSNPAPLDPKSDGTYAYTYSSTGTTFCLCASTMENTANANTVCTGSANRYCVVNP